MVAASGCFETSPSGCSKTGPGLSGPLVVRRGREQLVPWSAVSVDDHRVVLAPVAEPRRAAVRRTAPPRSGPAGPAGRRDPAGEGCPGLPDRRPGSPPGDQSVGCRPVSRASGASGRAVLSWGRGGLGRRAPPPRRRWLADRMRRQVLPIDQIHLTSSRGHQVQISASTSAVHQLDGRALSHLLTHLDVGKATT